MTKPDCSDPKIRLYLSDESALSEQQAMDCLYRRLLESATGWVRKHGGSAEDAEDCLVDALVLFVEGFRLGKFTQVQSPVEYVFGIAKKKFYDLCRKRKRDEGAIPDIPLDELPPNMGEWEDPFVTSEELDLLQKVEANLPLLPEKCQERLHRFFFLNESHETIAKALGDAGPNVSKTMLNRCKNRLRELTFGKNE